MDSVTAHHTYCKNTVRYKSIRTATVLFCTWGIKMDVIPVTIVNGTLHCFHIIFQIYCCGVQKQNKKKMVSLSKHLCTCNYFIINLTGNIRRRQMFLDVFLFSTKFLYYFWKHTSSDHVSPHSEGLSLSLKVLVCQTKTEGLSDKLNTLKLTSWLLSFCPVIKCKKQ